MLDEFGSAWGVFDNCWANLNVLGTFFITIEDFEYARGVFDHCWIISLIHVINCCESFNEC